MSDSRIMKGTCHCQRSGWTLEGDLGSITACNCNLCRRYGALWAYDYENERVGLSGDTASYLPARGTDQNIETRFCGACGCVVCWRGLETEADGRRRMAVNIRLAPPDAVAALPIDHFDGLNTFEDLPSDGKCVKDLWF